MKPRALDWICGQPTPYNDFFFHSLSADPDIDLTVHFTESALPSHPWKSPMAQGFRSRTFRRRFGLDWHMLRLANGGTKSFLVVAGWSEPTLIAVLNILMFRRQPFAIWTDTPNLRTRRHVVKAVIRKTWLRQVFEQARYVLGTGQPALNALESMGCPRQKLINFPYVVDLGLFSPRTEVQAGDFRKGVIFLSSGRLVNSHKGYDLAIQALAEVKKIASAAQFVYRIAGVGPDESILKSLVERFGLIPNVEFVNWLEACDMPHFYQSGHVFLHPSHFDPYGVSVLEAMSSGLPVIGSNQAGSVLDRVKHSQNGMIHQCNNVPDLTDKLLFVLTHTELLPAWGREARRTAECWSVRNSVQITKALLKEC